MPVFGFLYTKFDVEYFWWELTFLARRFFLVMLVVFFEGRGEPLPLVGFGRRHLKCTS
jgi:hypothetical protein